MYHCHLNTIAVNICDNLAARVRRHATGWKRQDSVFQEALVKFSTLEPAEEILLPKHMPEFGSADDDYRGSCHGSS